MSAGRAYRYSRIACMMQIFLPGSAKPTCLAPAQYQLSTRFINDSLAFFSSLAGVVA